MSVDSPMASPAPYKTGLLHPILTNQTTSYLEPAAASSSSRPLLPSRSSATSPIPSYPRHAGCVLCSLIIAAEDFGDAFITPDAPQSTIAEVPETERAASPSRDAFLVKGKGRFGQPYDPYAPPETGPSTRVNVHGKQIIYQDEEILVYLAEGMERLCTDGRHVIIVPKRHFSGVYELGPPDVPLLSHMLEIGQRLLPLYSKDHERKAEEGKVGFVGSVMKDPQSPHSHLHAHATIGPLDAANFFRRTVVYNPLNWWSIEDLRAEIREESSNNRVKSGYPDRAGAPINSVPDAGSRAGLPNALNYQNEITDAQSPGSPAETPTAGVNVVPPTPDLARPSTPSTSLDGRRDRGKGRAL